MDKVLARREYRKRRSERRAADPKPVRSPRQIKNESFDDQLQRDILARLGIRTDPRLDRDYCLPSNQEVLTKTKHPDCDASFCSEKFRCDLCHSLFNDEPDWDNESLASSISTDWDDEMMYLERLEASKLSIYGRSCPPVTICMAEEVETCHNDECTEELLPVTYCNASTSVEPVDVLDFIVANISVLPSREMEKYYSAAIQLVNPMGLIALRSLPYSRKCSIPSVQRKFNRWFDKRFEFNIPHSITRILIACRPQHRNSLNYSSYMLCLHLIGKRLINRVLSVVRYPWARNKIKRYVWKTLLKKHSVSCT